MSTLRPSTTASSHTSALPRTPLLVMPGGRDAQGVSAVADRLAAETDELLDTLDATVARLALAHRSCTPDPEAQGMDQEAFAWVQQSLEDISATLRGLALGRASEALVPDQAPLRSATGHA